MKAVVVSAVMVALLVAGRVQAAVTWISCTPVEIMTYQIRVHVRCAAAVGGITYFAAATQDTSQAARVLSVITAAQVAGRTLTNQRFVPDQGRPTGRWAGA